LSEPPRAAPAGPAEAAGASDADAVGELLQELVNRVSHRGQGQVLALMNEASVTLQQLLMLGLLAQRGECTASELARELNMSQSATSQMVERLFQLDYVRRAEDPQDRRQKRLALTPAAAQVLARIHRARSAEYGAGVAPLTPALRAELASVLRRVLAELRLRDGPAKRDRPRTGGPPPPAG